VYQEGYKYDEGGSLKTKYVGCADSPDGGVSAAPPCSQWQYAYGTRGELQSVTLPTGPTATYVYDGQLRLASVTPPGPSAAQTFKYDELGRVVVRTRGTSSWGPSVWTGTTVKTPGSTGETVTSAYDGRNRLVSESYTPYAQSVATPAKAMGWDALDALTSATQGSEAKTWEYDGVTHLLQSVSRNGVKMVKYDYDVDKQRKSEVVATTDTGLPADGGMPGGITYGYDNTNRRLNSVTGDFGTMTVGWEAGGERLVELTSPTLSQKRCYDEAGRLVGIATVAVGSGQATPATDCLSGSGAASFEYWYDTRGNRNLERRGDGAARVSGYDDADRLNAVTEFDGTVISYHLNDDGSRDTETVTAGLQSAQPSTYAYGGPGGELSGITGAKTATYTFDGEGRLQTRTLGSDVLTMTWRVDGQPATIMQGGVTTAYEYDAQGMRRRASVGTNIVGTWTWGGPSGEEWVGENGKQIGRVAGLPISSGSVRFGLDGLGSVVARTSGTLVSSYGAWGASSTGPGAGEATNAYAQGSRDGVTDRFGLRVYLSEAGVFASSDSVGAASYLTRPSGLGPFSYASNNPLLNVDPDGRDNGFSECRALEQRGASDMASCMKGMIRPNRKRYFAPTSAGPEPVTQGPQAVVEGAAEHAARMVMAPAELVAHSFGYDSDFNSISAGQQRQARAQLQDLNDAAMHRMWFPPLLLKDVLVGTGTAMGNVGGALVTGDDRAAGGAALDLAMQVPALVELPGLASATVESGLFSQSSWDVEWVGQEPGTVTLYSTPIPKKVTFKGPPRKLLYDNSGELITRSCPAFGGKGLAPSRRDADGRRV
jgi:RHS repeat-associated protein